MVEYEPKPLDCIPMVKVIDEHGKTVHEGYYFCYPKWCPYPISDGTQKVELVEGIVMYEQGDWGMPNKVRFVSVTPPHRIVPL